MQKHASSEKHCTKAKAIMVKQPAIEDCFSKSTQLSQRVKESEIRIAAFLAEHNIAFNAVEHLVPLIKLIGKDPEVAKNIHCGRKKITQIVKNVTGVSGFEKIKQSLESNKFSLIVDESTDISSVKHLVLIARCFDGKSISDQFLGLIPVADARALSLYQ